MKCYRIRCVYRDSKKTIIGFGGDDWSKNKNEVYDEIENDGCSFYVEDEKKNKVNVIVIKKEKDSFHIRTTPDESKINNLNDLPDCEHYHSIDWVASRMTKQLRGDGHIN